MANRSRQPGRHSRRWTEDDARQLLDEWAQSGVNLHRFAQGRGITPQRLAWWRKRLRPSPPAPAFVPASVTVESIGALAQIAVRQPSGVAIELGDVSPAWVARLIRELARLS